MSTINDLLAPVEGRVNMARAASALSLDMPVTDLARLVAAIKAVAAEHDPAPITLGPNDLHTDYCIRCDVTYPCLTIRVVEQALGGAE